jgi:hypothetical protein
LLNKYNKIAHFYTGLSRLVFGNQLLKIQQELITHLPTDGKLLILGGGNGKILPLIYQHAPRLSINYVEASSTMIQLAKKRAPNQQKITFHHIDVLDYCHKHDHIYAGFFLDLFHEKQIEELILKLENIKSETTWYIADFQLNRNTKYRLIRTIQLNATILFFRIATQHSIKHLPNIDTLFIQMKYAPKTETKGYLFIFCEVFKKQI